MCDAISGDLLLAYRYDDPAANGLIESIRNQRIPHVSFLESIGDRLARIGLKARPSMTFNFVRLEVPAGEEEFKGNIIQFLYRQEIVDALDAGRMSRQKHGHILTDSRNSIQIARNSILTVAAVSRATSAPSGPAGTGFAFDPVHTSYLGLLGLGSPVVGGSGRRVAILDTGLDPSIIGPVIVGRHNFVDPTQATNTTDDHNHGSAIASVIHAVAPSAELVIYKVADAHGRASEWDTLAALAARPPGGQAIDVINLSLDFGLADRTCVTCGRESMSSRSAVFESMLDQLKSSTSSIVVGAAGNFGKNELAFPARFGTTVAVLACDSKKAISGFSNYGAVDQAGLGHAYVFVLPGGQKSPIAGSAATEYVGISANGDHHWGTSVAAAYASGLIAAAWSKSTHSAKNAAQMLSALRSNADASYPGYKPDHGNGLMQDC